MRPPATRIVAAALAAGLGSCGDAPPPPEVQVRAKLAQFSRATGARDYETLCTQVYASGLTARLDSVGLPCPVALRQALASVRDPQLRVGRVTVAGASATAQVRTSAVGQAPSRDTVRLRREEGGWRIVALAGQGGGPRPSPVPEER